MKERPIIFSGEMVRAILAGRKTQTRRVVTPRPPSVEAVRAKSGDAFHLFTDFNTPGVWRVAGSVWAVRDLMGGFGGGPGPRWRCPYGVPGDRLWVREAYSVTLGYEPPSCEGAHDHGEVPYLRYPADDWMHRAPHDVWSWELRLQTRGRKAVGRHDAMFMPRWASRLTLELTGVRVQRLLDISEEDARAEGVVVPDGRPEMPDFWSYRQEFGYLWDQLNAKRGFGRDTNPWVWALAFRLVQP